MKESAMTKKENLLTLRSKELTRAREELEGYRELLLLSGSLISLLTRAVLGEKGALKALTLKAPGEVQISKTGLSAALTQSPAQVTQNESAYCVRLLEQEA